MNLECGGENFYMKKSTLNAIMQGVIIVLVIAIIFIIIQIKIKPEPEISSELVSQEISEEPSVSEEEPVSEFEPVIVDRVRMIRDNINVRSGPGTEYERLGSAYSGYDFELVEQLESGWTKIIYDGKDAYVYTEYIEVIPMILQEDGSYTEYVNLENNAGSEQ